jgi:hypothetical protein
MTRDAHRMNTGDGFVRVAPPWTIGRPIEGPYVIRPVPVEPSQPPGAQQPIALIVSHGMGQQVPFETLGLVAGILRSAEARAHGASPEIVVRRVKLAERELTRAEIRVTGEDGRPRHVHLYETYWAPLTEGKVTVRDTVWFLIGAAWQGMKSNPFGVFKRFLFSAWQVHESAWRTRVALLGALLVTLSLVLMNTVIAGVTTLRIATGSSSPWTNSALLGDLTALFALFLITAAMLGAGGIALPRGLRGLPRPDGSRRVPGGALLAVSWACVWLAVIIVIGMTFLIIAAFAQQHFSSGIRLFDFPLANRLVGAINREVIPGGQMAFMLTIWGWVLGASIYVRGFLLQYVGDVAAYISAHTVSRFNEIRATIQDAAFRTVRDVYFATATKDSPPLYSNVIMVGHSLGSVIAYDMLNAIIRHDALLDRPTNAAGRTSMLLTFGSPLDKTAYVFRTQRVREAEVREAAAAAVQSIITDVALRPARWVNIWSKADWISGSLDFYDPPPQTLDGRMVTNCIDPEATTPIAAHTEYWENRLLADTLYQALIAAPQPAGMQA